MGWTKDENCRRKAIRTWRLLYKENRERPIRYWGTLHISCNFDLAKLRRGLSLAHGKGEIPATFAKIEQTKRAVRPHLHLLWHDDPDKPKLRRTLVGLLEWQGVPSRRIRLSVQKIDNGEAVFRYVSKARTNCTDEKRTTFHVGKFFHKPTKEILKKTPREIWEAKIRHVMRDPVAFHCILTGAVSREEVANPRWVSYWKRVGWHHHEPHWRTGLGSTPEDICSPLSESHPA
ncbi:hypothetical protein [Alienimonas sp. DA493]|uniref:hypothetical protein n=1 Tax=Alienimonas sp. DA493 TaxID=3373605 RepID=UPI0037553ECC